MMGPGAYLLSRARERRYEHLRCQNGPMSLASRDLRKWLADWTLMEAEYAALEAQKEGASEAQRHWIDWRLTRLGGQVEGRQDVFYILDNIIEQAIRDWGRASDGNPKGGDT